MPKTIQLVDGILPQPVDTLDVARTIHKETFTNQLVWSFSQACPAICETSRVGGRLTTLSRARVVIDHDAVYTIHDIPPNFSARVFSPSARCIYSKIWIQYALHDLSLLCCPVLCLLLHMLLLSRQAALLRWLFTLQLVTIEERLCPQNTYRKNT